MEVKDQILALRADGKEAPYTVKSPTGEVMIIADEPMADFFSSSKPLPQNSDLDNLFETATRAELRPVILEDGYFVAGAILAEASGDDLRILQKRLQIRTPEQASHCATWGTHRLEVFEGDNRLATLEMIDFDLLRWGEKWNSDAEFADDGLGLAEWMSSLGNPEPLEAYRNRKSWQERYALDLERWRSAMPACLDPMWDRIQRWDRIHGTCTELIQPALELLTLAYPSQLDIILTLLRWLSLVDSADSLRANFPASVIATFPIGQIESALEMLTPETEQGGYVFCQARPQLRAQLRPDIRRKF